MQPISLAVLGLCGHDPVTINILKIDEQIDFIKANSEPSSGQHH